MNRHVLSVSQLHGMVWPASCFLTVPRTRQAAARRAQVIIGERQQAQRQYLRFQINPHFFFNPLREPCQGSFGAHAMLERVLYQLLTHLYLCGVGKQVPGYG